MKNIKVYLDHNIIDNENNWEEISRLNCNDNIKFVFSDFNLIEIGQRSDRNKAIKQAKFIDTLKPLWAIDLFTAQCLEMEYFLKQYYYKITSEIKAKKFLYEYLSQILSFRYGVDIPIGCSAEKMVRGYLNINMQSIHGAKNDHLSTANIMKKQKGEINIDLEVFYAYFSLRIPKGDKSECKKILDFLYKNKDLLFDSCYSIKVEDDLYEMHKQDKLRKPEIQDAIDLQHIVTALSTCTYFVSNDGYLQECARKIKNNNTWAAKVFVELVI